MTTTSARPSWLRTFAVIYTGQAFSLLGSTAASFALVWWLAIGTGSAAVLAYASIAATLPQAVVMPLAGDGRHLRAHRPAVGSAFHSTASQAAVPMYVPGEELTGEAETALDNNV